MHGVVCVFCSHGGVGAWCCVCVLFTRWNRCMVLCVFCSHDGIGTWCCVCVLFTQWDRCMVLCVCVLLTRWGRRPWWRCHTCCPYF